MHLLKLQERCRVQKLHAHGVRADAEAHEFAVARPQAERQADVIGDHLHVTGAGCFPLSGDAYTRSDKTVGEKDLDIVALQPCVQTQAHAGSAIKRLETGPRVLLGLI